MRRLRITREPRRNSAKRSSPLLRMNARPDAGGALTARYIQFPPGEPAIKADRAAVLPEGHDHMAAVPPAPGVKRPVGQWACG